MFKTLATLLFFLNLQFCLQGQFLCQIGKEESLYSQILDENRNIYVQLPKSYSSGQNYPVAYLLDGEILLPVTTIVHQFYSGGYIPEMILIGIDNSNNRTRDLTPTRITSKYGMPFIDETGGASNFALFLEKELIPYVEKNYRVNRYRTLIGHSYGGLFVTHMLLNRPDLFDNYLAIDPSMDWDDQILLTQATGVSTKNIEGKHLYVSLSGQLHMQNPDITIANVMQDQSDFTLFARSNIAFSESMRNKKDVGLNFQWEFFEKDIHGTVSVPSMRNGLVWLFDWFQMEQTDKFNSPETPIDELLQVIRYRAEKLRDHFGYEVPPYPEELINMSGYMSMDMGQIEKAKMFFELGIEFFPDSPNVYDSMADYYVRQNDPATALEYVSKAYKLSGAAYYKERMAELGNK